MTMFTSRLGTFVFSTMLVVALAPFAAGCGNGDDDAINPVTSDAGADAAGEIYDVGCDQTVNDVHTCIAYQFLTTAQQASLSSACTSMGGKDVSSSTDTCPNDSTEVGSCEVATGSNVKQFTVYYDDNGYTEAQAMAACTAANGDFKE